MVKFVFLFFVFEFNVNINEFQLEYPTARFIVWKVFGTWDAKQAKRETMSACRTIMLPIQCSYFKVFRPKLLAESIFLRIEKICVTANWSKQPICHDTITREKMKMGNNANANLLLNNNALNSLKYFVIFIIFFYIDVFNLDSHLVNLVPLAAFCWDNCWYMHTHTQLVIKFNMFTIISLNGDLYSLLEMANKLFQWPTTERK